MLAHIRSNDLSSDIRPDNRVGSEWAVFTQPFSLSQCKGRARNVQHWGQAN